eukprot:scaffold116607_cov60-Phaeocystis_antarctica.AAC.1
MELTVTGPYSPLQVIERFGRTRVEVARAAAVLDGVGLRLPCSGTGGTGVHELAHLVVHRRVDLGGGAQVAAAEGRVGSGKLEHGGLGFRVRVRVRVTLPTRGRCRRPGPPRRGPAVMRPGRGATRARRRPPGRAGRPG